MKLWKKNLNRTILNLIRNNLIKNKAKGKISLILLKKRDLLNNINRKYQNIKKKATKKVKIFKKKTKLFKIFNKKLIRAIKY